MTAKTTRRVDGKIHYDFWLVFSSDGRVRQTRTAPSVNRDERAMKLTAVLPARLFETPPLVATVTVPDVPGETPQVDLDVGEKALKLAWGVDVDLQVAEELEE